METHRQRILQDGFDGTLTADASSAVVAHDTT